jgi:AcrR family transcriptional regulator
MTSADLSETQESILDAAMSCIVRDGIDGASMRKVAREADVSLGLLSYHFDDKRSLIVAAFKLATDRLLESSLGSLDDIDGTDERVCAFIRGAFHGKFLEPDYLALRLALWAISRTDDQIAVVEKRHNTNYVDKMAALIADARPDLGRERARQRAIDVVALQNGLWLSWARYADQTDLDRGLDRCDDIALAPATGLDTGSR